MKKILYLSFILLACHATGFSQSLQYQWARGAGGFSAGGYTVPDHFSGMATDRDGNTYVVGYIIEYPIVQDTILHPPAGSFGLNDIFMAKYDKCGKLIWYYIYGTPEDDRGYQVSLSPEQDYFYTTFYLGGTTPRTTHLQMANGDTAVGIGVYTAKVSTATGKINKLLHYDLTYMTGGTYRPDLNTAMHYLSSNRLVAYVYGSGNFDGNQWNDNDGHIALMDSDLHIIRWALLDTGVSNNYLAYNFGRMGFTSDRNGNLYGELIPMNTTMDAIQIYDSTYRVDGANGGKVFFSMDTLFHLRRAVVTNMGLASPVADDNIYISVELFSGLTSYWNRDSFNLTSQWPFSSNGNNAVLKLDSNLNIIGRCFGDAQYANFPQCLNVTNNKVYAEGWGYGEMTWGADTIHSIPNHWETIVWEISKSTMCPVNAFVSPGYAVNNVLEMATSMDEQGNVYIGGTYHNILYTAHDTIAASGGSTSPDIYVEKWGFDCADSVHSLREPLEPTALVATATGAHAVQVVWQDQSRYETGFHIWRSPDGVSSWTLIDSVAANVTQYIDASVQPNTAYWYRAAAFNVNGDSYYTNTDSALTWRVTAIDEVSKDLPYVNLYPNPGRDQVTLDVYSTESTTATIRVTGINGELISTTDLSLSEGMNHHPLAIGHMAAGVYFVSITTPGSYVCRRLVRID